MANSPVRTGRRRLWWKIALCLAAVIALAVFANIKLFPTEDPYRNWPATGTMSQGAPLYINGLVALTCNKNGNPYMEERSFGTDKNGRKVLPSEYIAFYTDYFPKKSDDCEARIAPMVPDRLVLRIIDTNGETWGESVPVLSFDGLKYMTASKKKSGIAVLLISNSGLSPGPEVKMGTNGLPAPSKELVS